uniref:Uncharacterized protein n=1 Tax=Branchiostoma floridae TaxID=7739 RepID=C3ZQ71_BRAFL|eukprot:XP_002589439.1 hypothetical protein BRAFLDRAFT_80165 [Branchiostoma floridae]
MVIEVAMVIHDAMVIGVAVLVTMVSGGMVVGGRGHVVTGGDDVVSGSRRRFCGWRVLLLLRLCLRHGGDFLRCSVGKEVKTVSQTWRDVLRCSEGRRLCLRHGGDVLRRSEGRKVKVRIFSSDCVSDMAGMSQDVLRKETWRDVSRRSEGRRHGGMSQDVLKEGDIVGKSQDVLKKGDMVGKSQDVLKEGAEIFGRICGATGDKNVSRQTLFAIWRKYDVMHPRRCSVAAPSGD